MMNFPLIFDENLVLDKIDLDAVLSNLRIAFKGLHLGTSVQPNEVVTELPDDAGDCIFYAGLVAELGAFGVAVSPFLNSREMKGLSPVTSYTLLLSTETGLPLLFCDSKLLTTIRTAATTMLAICELRNGTEKSLTIVGAGSIGIEHARQARAMNLFEKITIVSPSLINNDSHHHSERRNKVAAIGNSVLIGSSIEDAVRSADVVMLCTDSATPVVESNWLMGVKIVTSLSTNAPGAHEIDPSFLQQAEVFCDYRKTCPTIAGEMSLAISKGDWSADDIIADLPELMAEKIQHKFDTKKPRYFRSVGMGIEDIAVACSLI